MRFMGRRSVPPYPPPRPGRATLPSLLPGRRLRLRVEVGRRSAQATRRGPTLKFQPQVNQSLGHRMDDKIHYVKSEAKTGGIIQ